MKNKLILAITFLTIMCSTLTSMAGTMVQTSTSSFDYKSSTTIYYCSDCGSELNFKIGPKTIQWDAHQCTHNHGEAGWSLHYFPSWATTTLKNTSN